MPIQFDCEACGKKVQAPETALGKKVRCPHCQGILQVPSSAFEPETPASNESGLPTYGMQPDAAAAPAGEKRVPCPVCGEKIVAKAVKCRYCGEIFDETLRRESATATGKNAGDSDLTLGEKLVAIFLGGIGCIVGLVWAIQGKPKGSKMIGLSIVAGITWRIIFFVISQIAKQ